MSGVVAQHMDSETLFRRHGAFVARLLHRLGFEVPELDDLLQEVFLVAHRNDGYRAGPAKPTTYLASIAVKVAATHRRKRRTRSFVRSSDTLVSGATASEAGPERMADAREQLRTVQRILEGLDADRRAIFVLFELEGLACAEIAAAMGIPVGTVYSRLHTARAHIQDAIEREAKPSPLAALISKGRKDEGPNASVGGSVNVVSGA